jgi:peroxiredoxin
MLACAVALMASGELSGRRAPGFSLPDMHLQQHDTQDYRGKILLIEIMQTVCPHCVAFSPILEEAVGKYRGQVAVLEIVVPPDNLSTVKQYIRAHNVTVPILFDCGQAAASYIQATPQNSEVRFPHLFIIDAQGMIRNDYAYSPFTRGIFEGRDLFTELDHMLGKSK